MQLVLAIVSATVGKKRRVLRSNGPAGILGLLYASLIASLTLTASKVKGDELPRDGPPGLCANLHMPRAQPIHMLTINVFFIRVQ